MTTIPLPRRAADSTPQQPTRPKPTPSTPWPNPPQVPPGGPRYAEPDAYAVTLGRAQGAHGLLRLHLDVHGNECGPTCLEFARLFVRLGATLTTAVTRPALRAVA